MAENKIGAVRQYSVWFVIIVGIFITCLITANIIAVKLVTVFGLTLPAAVIVFPISYIFGDVLTEVYGYGRSRRVIWTGFACLAVCAGVLWLVRIMPGEASWAAGGGQEAFEQALGGMSTGGIVLASLVAYFAGEFSNSFVLAEMKILTGGRWLWTRTIGSTLVGEAVDTAVFITVASLTGVFPWTLFVTLLVTNYIFKVAIEAAMTPLTYRVVRFLKGAEGVDWYDRGTNFNPFALRRPGAASR